MSTLQVCRLSVAQIAESLPQIIDERPKLIFLAPRPRTVYRRVWLVLSQSGLPVGRQIVPSSTNKNCRARTHCLGDLCCSFDHCAAMVGDRLAIPQRPAVHERHESIANTQFACADRLAVDGEAGGRIKISPWIGAQILHRAAAPSRPLRAAALAPSLRGHSQALG